MRLEQLAPGASIIWQLIEVSLSGKTKLIKSCKEAAYGCLIKLNSLTNVSQSFNLENELKET